MIFIHQSFLARKGKACNIITRDRVSFFWQRNQKKKKKRNLYEGTFRIGLFQFKMLTILTSNFSSKTVFLHIYIYIYILKNK